MHLYVKDLNCNLRKQNNKNSRKKVPSSGFNYQNLTHRYVFRLKFGEKSKTSLAKLALDTNASVCSTIKDLF